MTRQWKKNWQLSRAIKLALMAGTIPVMTMHVALAQEAGDEQQAQNLLEEVIVTGSRIPARNIYSASPVLTVNADEIEYQGVTRIEDLLNALPQVKPTQQSGVANGASGTATVDLRGLEAVRTLVLLNGRRMPAGSPGPGALATDLNQIPAALIDRIEVLTGGASATYGSDAVAGVVNFITKTDFEGFTFDFQYSGYSHKNNNDELQQINADAGFDFPDGSVTDGEGTNYNMAMGVNSGDGKGNVTIYATYRDIKPIIHGGRDYSNCAVAGSPGNFRCGGSSTLPEGRITDFGVLSGVGPGTFDYIVQGDQFVPRDGLLYNYAPSNHFQRPDERIIAGGYGHYTFNDHLELFAEVSYMDDKTVAQIAPSGAFFVTSSLPCSNPLLSDQQFQLICGDFGLTTDDVQTVFLGRRNVEGGFRQDTLRHNSSRVVFGARGEINDTWSYEAYFNYGQTVMSETYLNDLSTTRIIRALDVVPDPVTGEAVCRSVLNGVDPACIPWNIFTTGGVPEGRDTPIQQYLSVPLFATGEVTTTVYNAYVSADLGDYGWQIPSADAGIQVVGGFERREETLIFTPDVGFASGDGAGQGGPIQGVIGDFDVDELFFEAAVPLWAGQNFASVNLNLGYRYSDYSTGVDTDTYKVSGDWALNDSIRLRASYQRAVRVGNLRELFRPQTIQLFDMDLDPCAGAVPVASFEECARTGVTADQYGTIADSPAGQYNFIGGGNRDLIPETSDTVSVGFIWTPTAFAQGLIVSADYYKIDIEDAISAIAPDFILDQCLAAGLPIWCDAVNRGALTGTLWIGQDNIMSTDINIGSLTREGIDLQVGYDFDVGSMGVIDINLAGVYLITANEVPTPGGDTIVCKGTWDNSQCGAPSPEWGHNFRVTWATPWDLNITGYWRYLDGVTETGVNQADFPSFSWFDLAGVWQATETFSLRVGLNNVFDKEPPLSSDTGAGFGSGNTFPGVYDARGRYWFLGFSVTL